MRQSFMQALAGECGGGGGGGVDAVRTLQSVPYAHIGYCEPGLPSLLSLL